MSRPLLCETVSAETTADLRRRRDEARADLVELRLDSVRDPDVAGALSGRKSPVIVTCRPTWEGGSFSRPEEDRKRILREALALGAEYVDIEWHARFTDLIEAEQGRRVVLSMHSFDGVPSDLSARLSAMRASGAQVIKMAVTATSLSECAALSDFGVQAAGAGALVLIAMGEYGLPTRLLPERFGSSWSYAGSLNGVGQLTSAAMLDDYRFRTINASTAVYGIVGSSVGHSVSPAMHNAAFRARDIDAIYIPLPARDVDDFLTFGKALGLKGASVTMPHKVALFDRLDEVYAGARRTRAVNTVRVEDGRWIGDNTDVGGFLEPLRDRLLSLAGLRVSVLGAGGAARAVADALTSSRCTVRVHARQRERAAEVASLVSAEIGPWPPERGSWDLLVNCTPVGQTPNDAETPVPMDLIEGGCVYDLVYNPPATRLLQEAAEMGCQTISGVEMLVAQAQEQFRWWTGTRPPPGVMKNAALKRLAEF
ncbi:MAG TPA: shikimate dehydrogenase [Vicinamibacterales bacterium]